MTLKKIDHTFAYDQLSYDAKPNEQPYIKLSFFFSKLPDVSYEHFHRHWQSIHSDLTIGTKAFKSNKIQRYVQVKTFISEYAVSESHGLHISVAFLPEMKKMVTDSGLDLLDYDGCSEIYVKNFEDWDNFSKSEEFQRALMPDAPRMGMQLPFRCFASVENIIYGPGLEEMGGKAGVTADTPRSDGK